MHRVLVRAFVAVVAVLSVVLGGVALSQPATAAGVHNAAKADKGNTRVAVAPRVAKISPPPVSRRARLVPRRHSAFRAPLRCDSRSRTSSAVATASSTSAA